MIISRMIISICSSGALPNWDDTNIDHVFIYFRFVIASCDFISLGNPLKSADLTYNRFFLYSLLQFLEQSILSDGGCRI